MSELHARDSRGRVMLAGFLASVLGLAAGIGTGVPEGKALAGRLFTMRVAAVETQLAAFSAMQFQHADSEHARRAVRAEIETLEGLAPLSGQLSQQAASRLAALYLAYARLSLIEQNTGDSAAAQRARQRAGEYWSRLHPGSELSSNQMAQSVRDFDQARPAQLIQ